VPVFFTEVEQVRRTQRTQSVSLAAALIHGNLHGFSFSVTGDALSMIAIQAFLVSYVMDHTVLWTRKVRKY
jgi:hypothetical protein